MRKLVFIFALACQLLFAFETKLTLFSFKHEWSENNKSTLASLMTTLEEERKKCPHHLTVLSGDFLSPFCLSSVDKGANVVELLSELKVDLVSLGNHEFDFGVGELKKRIKESKNFKWIASNTIDLDQKPLNGSVDCHIVEVDGIKIGFLGLIDHSFVINPEVYFLPLYETARLKCEDLKKRGAEVIVALTHLSLEDNKRLAKEVADIHLVLGGHDKKSITYYVNDALVHNLGEDPSFLSRIDLVLKKEKGAVDDKISIFPSVRLININAALPNSKIEQKIQSYYVKYKDLSDTVITLKEDLDATFNTLRSKESVFGNVVADAIKEALQADLSILNSGIFCSNSLYPKNKILLKKDLHSEFLFNNSLCLIEMKGSDLIEVLENSILLFDQKSPRFPLVSGLKFSFDPNKEPYKRIGKVEANNLPLEPEKIYRVATVDYLVLGGDGFMAFKKGRVLEKRESLVEALTVYLKKQNSLPLVEGRIKLPQK